MDRLPPSGSDVIASGIALRIASAGCFSVMSALLKVASTDGVVAPEMLFYRAVFGLPVVVIWVMTSQGGLSALRTERPWAHLRRSALGISGILCIFQALTMLPLADATTLGFTAPIFATVMSALILHETVGRHRWIAVLIGFVGVAVVMRPHAVSGGAEAGVAHTLPLLGIGVGLLGAVLQAAVNVTLRQLKDTEHVAAIVFWFFVASAIVGVLLLPFVGHWHDGATLALLIGGGVAGGLAQLTVTASLKAAPVAVVAPFDYLQIIGAVGFGWWLLSSPPSLNTLVGAALIAASGLYTVWREHRRHKDRMIQPTATPV
ncbi:DMT family transporter [soil metagenome]